MKQAVLKLIGSGVLFGLVALGGSANPVSVTLNGSGNIVLSSSGSGNLTVCLGSGSTCANSVNVGIVGTGNFAGVTSLMITGGPISLTEQGSLCVFANAALTGVTFAGGSLSGTINSLTISQTSAQLSSGLATISGTGTITSILGVMQNVDFNFSQNLNVGVNVDICAIPSGGVTGTVAPTPEPLTLVLMGTGLLFIGGTVRRRLAS